MSGIVRRHATSATLRDNEALMEYTHDLQELLLTLSIELPMVARASKVRLKTAPARSSLMPDKEKQAAAAQVARALANAARVMRYASQQVAKADGIVTHVFTPRHRHSNHRNRGGGDNRNRNAA